jgi:hypothetical protein
MDKQQVIADLRATRDRMTPENWCGDGWTGPLDSQKCVLHHLSDVINEECPASSTRWREASNAMARHIPYRNDTMGYNVGNYNDMPTTTFEDIQVLVDKTLAELGGMCADT